MSYCEAAAAAGGYHHQFAQYEDDMWVCLYCRLGRSASVFGIPKAERAPSRARPAAARTAAAQPATAQRRSMRPALAFLLFAAVLVLYVAYRAGWPA